MDKNLKSVMDEHFSHVKFNDALAKKLYHFNIGFVNKNEDHMTFFGGCLTGVQVVRWSPRDTSILFDEILTVDVDDLEEAIKTVPNINQKFKVSSDTFNLTFMYLIHRFLTTPLLNDTKRIRGALDCALIFNYRILTGIMAGWFKYPANEATAQATYAELSYKFLLKKLGSWGAVLEFRSAEMVSKDGIHYKRFIAFDNDLEIIKIINDSQGRIKDLLKNIYATFIKVHNSGGKISSSSMSSIDTDGVAILKDKLHGLELYTGYIVSIMHDKNSFIKPELVNVVLDLMFTTQENVFLRTLNWFSDNINYSEHTEIEKLIRLVMVHSYEHLTDDSEALQNTKDLAGFLTRIKGVYLSSRSTDKHLLEMREIGFKLIKKASGSYSENTIASIRTSFFLYVVLRAYTKNYYMH